MWGVFPTHASKFNHSINLLLKDNYYLEEVRRMPLTPPKVERATATGMRKANWPYSLPAKVCKVANSCFWSLTRRKSTHHSHCLRTEDFRHIERRVEGNVCCHVDDGDSYTRDHDSSGKISHGVLHLLNHKVEVVPAIVSKESWEEMLKEQ